METFAFTQCASVLFETAPKLEDVQRALQDWTIAGDPNPGSGQDAWAVCGPGFVVELRAGGFAIVDVVDRPWPDDARDAAANLALASAWHAAAFGPASMPYALARAIDQSWTWPEGPAVASRHGAFVRVRTGIAAMDGEQAERPRGVDALYELTSVTELARPLLAVEGALALFVPGGEALRSRRQVEEALDRKVGVAPPPLELWTNVRSIGLPPESDVRWLVLDVVGMRQLGLADQEAFFAEGQEQPDAVEEMLRDACQHLVSARKIPPGSTTNDARGRRWRATAANGVIAPPRPVLRWLPEESARPTEATFASVAAAVTAGTG